jgi:hypothetical protein
MVLAERTYKHLKQHAFKKATFIVIEGEVHQYKKDDAFTIIDQWIKSGCESTESQRYPRGSRLAGSGSDAPLQGPSH